MGNVLYWCNFHVAHFYELLMLKNSVLATTKSNQPAVYCKNGTVRARYRVTLGREHCSNHTAPIFF